MNYLISFAIIMMGTVLAALGDSPSVRWLLISDGNVALALFFAWWFDKGKINRPVNIVINRFEGGA